MAKRKHRRLAILLTGLALIAVLGFGLAQTRVVNILQSQLARLVPGMADDIRGLDPIPLTDRLRARGFELGQPVLLRLFKEDGVLELWMDRGDRYDLAMTYPICRWSGTLGPKLREGDGQSPEGFYRVSRRQLKPDSDYYRAINVGFPNAFDLQNGRTGSFLMIHGDCVSIGCYAMTDAGIDDIYQTVEQALQNGQAEISVQIFPFRMTADNLSRHAASPWLAFWQNLAEGDRVFDQTGRPPEVGVCDDRYVFASEGREVAAGEGCEPVRGW